MINVHRCQASMKKRALHLRRALPPLVSSTTASQKFPRVSTPPCSRYPSLPFPRIHSLRVCDGSMGELRSPPRLSYGFCSTMETVSESEWSETDGEDSFQKGANELSEEEEEEEEEIDGGRECKTFHKKTLMHKEEKKEKGNVAKGNAFETEDDESEEGGEETDFGSGSDEGDSDRVEESYGNGRDSYAEQRQKTGFSRNFSETGSQRDGLSTDDDGMGGNHQMLRHYDGTGGKHDRGHRKNYIQDSDADDIEIESDSEDELQAEVERQMAAEPKVVRPSVTWGILLSKEHRKASRETVLTYLQSEGIHTSELKAIELPTTLDVMKTRLGFLRKLGLSNDDINNYPLALGCSVHKNMVPVLRYLKKIGIKEHWVTGLVRKYPMILHASVVIDILPVIYFLRGLDIDPVDLPPILTRYPDILGFKTDGTMSTSVAYLVSMGVKMRHVGRMLTEYPEVLGMRVASVIKPKVEYLMSLGMPQTIVASILERRPQILGYDLESRMKYNVSQLIGIGVREEFVPGMIAQFPELLGRVFSPSLAMEVEWLKQTLDSDLDGVSKMIEKLPQVIFLKEEVAMGRIRFLKSQRFSPKEIGAMASQCPQILVSSIDESLKPNYSFLTRDMKRSRQEVIEYPACLTYGLETRMRPRFKALGDKHGTQSLEWILNCSDGEFQKRLAKGYEDEEEKKVIGRAFVMGGLLPGKKLEEEQKLGAVKIQLEASFSSTDTSALLLPKRGFQLVTI